MAWWAWLLLAGSGSLLLTGILLLLPLRIFVRYLRENRKDQISLRLGLGLLCLRLELWKKEAAGSEFTWHLAAGKIRVAPAQLQKMARRMRWAGDVFHPENMSGLLSLRRQAAPLLKKITWSHFDLELSWGWDDPALTGLAAGGCWALGGILSGLLQEYFSVTARPRFQIRPLFRPAEMRLRWEGEAALALYRWLKLWHIVKTTGGAGSGTSSH